MKRREFITLLGGVAAAWPLAARAQERKRMRHIGVLVPATGNDPDFQAGIGAFQQGLAQFGWIIGRTIIALPRVGTRRCRYWPLISSEDRRPLVSSSRSCRRAMTTR